MPSEKAEKHYRQLLARHCAGCIHEQYSYIEKLKELVRPGIEWLDAGCGHNVIAPWANDSAATEADLLNRAKLVVGCDVDVVSLQKESHIRRVGSNLDQLSFAAEAFDLVSCNMVVEHLQHPEQVFSEFYRVLKPGGKAIILTPNVLHWTMMISRHTPHWFHVFVRETIFGSDETDVFPTVYRANTPSALPRRLKAAGFQKVELDLLPSVPHLVGTGPLLYFELMMHKISRKIPKTREILCAVAHKTG